MKLRSVTSSFFAGAFLASTAPVFAATVYIDSFNQAHSDVNGAVLDSSTGTSQLEIVTQTLTAGTASDAIGTTRTLTTSVGATVDLTGSQAIQTTVQSQGQELRLSNSLYADNTELPDHTTHKVTWTGITGDNQHLMTNVGAGDISDIQFVLRVDGASNRDPAYIADQYFEITLFNGGKTAGFRGVMTNTDFTSSGDFYITLSSYGTPSAGFDPDAVDKIVFQTNLAFTEGNTFGSAPEENAVLIKQITAIPEPSACLLSLSALGLTLFRRRR